jgi:ADP-dependent NAD(P)H-hydrate dehydratase / NAD(P)H-hydrate epimerase
MTRPFAALILTADEMRAAEAQTMAGGVSVDQLMERAGATVAEAAWRFGGGKAVLIACGPGNNGGDGYVAARILRDRGLPVRVAASAPPRTDVAKRARDGWGDVIETFDNETAASPLFVDALFGTGLVRPLDPAVRVPLDRLANSAQFRIAVDVPSGVDSDSGTILGAVASDVTIALGFMKPAHLLQPAAALCGQIRVADIGIEVSRAAVTMQQVTRPLLAPPQANDHKYKRGLVVVAAGTMPGAALLSAGAAQRSGAGYVMLATEQMGAGGALALVRRPMSQALADPRVSAIVIGPGLGASVAAKETIATAIASERPLVIDADGLTQITSEIIAQRTNATILTPHEGEFTRLFGALPGSKIDRARAASRRSGAVVIYKGADTVVAAPDGRIAINAGASPWLASAGTGDVLAGVCGAMLGRGLDPFAAACAAVWLHSEAARGAGAGMIADDLLDHLTAALARCS